MPRRVPVNFRLAVAFGIAFGLFLVALLMLRMALSLNVCWSCG